MEPANFDVYGSDAQPAPAPAGGAPLANFDAYGTTAEAAPPAPSSGGLDWQDIGKGSVGGLGRGVTGLAGTFGTAGDLARAGFRKVGVPESALDVGAMVAKGLPLGSLLTGPSGRDIQSKAEEYTGPFYQPHTTAGQYASTVGEFAPSALVPGGGGITARALNTVIPAVASETAGQLTKGQAIEPWARGIAGLGGAVAGGRIVTPAPPPTAARQAAIGVLDREGIPVTAGDRTGSQAVRWAETVAGDMPFSSGRYQQLRGDQATAVDRAITNRMFDPAELQARGVPADATLPAPDVMGQGRASLSDRYNDLSARNVLRSDPQLQQDLLAAQTNYERLALPSQRASGARDIGEIRNNIVDALVAGGGAVPGDVYQAGRSRMGTLAEAAKNSDPVLANALRDVRGALDRGMQRGLSPEDAAAWALNNQRWGNMRQLEPAIASAGENLSPAKVAQAMRTGRAGEYARSNAPGSLDELARAAATVIKPLPSSGTAQRLGWQNLFNAGNVLSAGGGAMGSLFGPLGTAAGIALPHVAARAVLSRPGQAYLSNQVAPQSMRDLLTQAAVQQAASQPSHQQRER